MSYSCQCYTNTNAFTGALKEAITMIGEICETEQTKLCSAFASQQTKLCSAFADLHDNSIEETNKKTEELKSEVKELKQEIVDMKETIKQLSELIIQQINTKTQEETEEVWEIPSHQLK